MYTCTYINNDESLTPQIKFIHYMYVVESVEPGQSSQTLWSTCVCPTNVRWIVTVNVDHKPSVSNHVI